MSYIRCLSNPEGLYIWHDVGGFIAINHSLAPPLANPPKNAVFPTIKVPVHAFETVCRKWAERTRTRVASRGLVVEEIYIFEKYLEDDRPKRYAIRISYKGEFVHLWGVTWEYVLQSVNRRRQREILPASHGAAGGRARAKKLSKKRRSEIATKAANARWKKQKRSRPKRVEDPMRVALP